MWLKEILSEAQEAETQLKTNSTPKEEVRKLLKEIEAEVSRTNCFTFDDKGYATLELKNKRYQAGRFETPSIGELKSRVKQSNARPRLVVVSGRSPLMDIGALQSMAGPGSLFQVAS